MGGDFAPRELVLGALEATKTLDVNLLLVGSQSVIEGELELLAPSESNQSVRFEVVDAPEVVEFREQPALVKERRGASIRVICELVREGRADACVTMGHTGAGIIAAMLTFDRIAHVPRPCVGIPFFGLQPRTFFLDVGAIVDCKPDYLVSFARMGSIYAERILGIPRPTIGLLTNGREDNKGNELTREVFARLKASNLNFVGNVEGYDLPNGTANVIVSDGMWGNIALKLAEGLSEQILERMTQRFAEDGSIEAVEPILREFRTMMDYTEIGAMPVLGVNGLILIGHGRSKARAVVGGIRNAMRCVEVGLLGALREGLIDV